MKRLAVLNIVGLTESLIGPHTPLLNEFLKEGAKAREKEKVSVPAIVEFCERVL